MGNREKPFLCPSVRVSQGVAHFVGLMTAGSLVLSINYSSKHRAFWEWKDRAITRIRFLGAAFFVSGVANLGGAFFGGWLDPQVKRRTSPVHRHKSRPKKSWRDSIRRSLGWSKKVPYTTNSRTPRLQTDGRIFKYSRLCRR